MHITTLFLGNEAGASLPDSYIYYFFNFEATVENSDSSGLRN